MRRNLAVGLASIVVLGISTFNVGCSDPHETTSAHESGNPGTAHPAHAETAGQASTGATGAGVGTGDGTGSGAGSTNFSSTVAGSGAKTGTASHASPPHTQPSH